MLGLFAVETTACQFAQRGVRLLLIIVLMIKMILLIENDNAFADGHHVRVEGM